MCVEVKFAFNEPLSRVFAQTFMAALRALAGIDFHIASIDLHIASRSASMTEVKRRKFSFFGGESRVEAIWGAKSDPGHKEAPNPGRHNCLLLPVIARSLKIAADAEVNHSDDVNVD